MTGPTTMLSLAGCIVCNDEGDVLMLHRRTPERSQWEIPGGIIEDGEDAKTAAIRELKEELGIDVKVVQKLGERIFDEDKKDMHYTWFLAEITAGEPRICEPDMYDKFGWFSLVTLGRRYDELSVGAKNFLEAMAYGEIDLAV